MEKYLKIGVITAAHGVKGEVKVFPTTDDALRFKKLKNVYISRHKDERLLIKIEGTKVNGPFAVLKLEGIDDRDEAEKYRKSELYIDREHAAPLGENEYYIGDLIDMEVYLAEDETRFGTIKDVMQTGANDVYVIESLSHGEVLLPAIKDCVKKVDVKAGKMWIHLLGGLI